MKPENHAFSNKQLEDATAKFIGAKAKEWGKTESRSLMESVEGEKYADTFKNVRIQHVMARITPDSTILRDDNILPKM
jgi:hypothetical protein